MHNSKTGLLEMLQDGLVYRVIEALVLDNLPVKVKLTPSDSKPLFNYDYCIQMSSQLRYSSVVRILLYLDGHTRPYIAYAV